MALCDLDQVPSSVRTVTVGESGMDAPEKARGVWDGPAGGGGC